MTHRGPFQPRTFCDSVILSLLLLRDCFHANSPHPCCEHARRWRRRKRRAAQRGQPLHRKHLVRCTAPRPCAAAMPMAQEALHCGTSSVPVFTIAIGALQSLTHLHSPSGSSLKTISDTSVSFCMKGCLNWPVQPVLHRLLLVHLNC